MAKYSVLSAAIALFVSIPALADAPLDSSANPGAGAQATHPSTSPSPTSHSRRSARHPKKKHKASQPGIASPGKSQDSGIPKQNIIHDDRAFYDA